MSVSHNSVAQFFFSTPNKSSFEYYNIYIQLKFQRVLAEFKGNPWFFSEQMRQILRTWVYFIWFFIFIPLLPIFLFLFFFFLVEWRAGNPVVEQLILYQTFRYQKFWQVVKQLILSAHLYNIEVLFYLWWRKTARKYEKNGEMLSNLKFFLHELDADICIEFVKIFCLIKVSFYTVILTVFKQITRD